VLTLPAAADESCSDSATIPIDVDAIEALFLLYAAIFVTRYVRRRQGYVMTPQVSSYRDVDFMRRALELAQRAALDNEVPVGAVLVLDEEVIGEGWNRPIGEHDPTAHAEIVALRAGAQRLLNYRLGGTTLYATLEPCAMCMGAVLNARISRVVFGAWDQKAGACGSVIDLPREPKLANRIDVFGGVCSGESAALLRHFFETRR
jgi:tRNA(adenine34) deaminase